MPPGNYNATREDPADALETGSFAIDPADANKALVRIVQKNAQRTIVGFQNIGAVSCWFASSVAPLKTAGTGKKLTPGSVFVLDNYIGDIWVAADAAGATIVDVFGAVRSQG